ncbi:pectin methylesterase [Cohnella sp. AR92]|nr:pectin methylesterase [Cohnella sp. AR92]
MVVAQDGSGDYGTIQAAVDSIPENHPERIAIEVRSGEYREKVVIDRRIVSLIGAGADRTVIRWGDHAKMTFPDGEPYHTFHSYTALIGGDGFVGEGITYANDAGPGELVGQAVAAYVDGDRAAFRRCRFIGWQDTLFTGPLPPNPLDRATFGGPREGRPRRQSRQYYEDCYIEGDVDFIFGSATAVFNRCEIFSKRGERLNEASEHSGSGWIVAPSTPAESECGYVFLSCRLTGNASPASVYLGRPWREHAKAAFVRCELGGHIRSSGWDEWNGRGAAGSVVFAEFGSGGTGAAAAGARVNWSRELTMEEADSLTPARVLAGTDGWDPLAR